MKTTRARTPDDRSRLKSARPDTLPHGPERQFLDLQRKAGNQAVTHLLEAAVPAPSMGAFVQRKAATKTQGTIDMEGETIRTSKSDLKDFRLMQGQAQSAIGKEIDRYVEAVQQGHRQGFAMFGDWYRSWERAKEESSSALASKICQFIFSKGLEIIFPEEEVFIQTLKKVAELAFEKAVDKLGEIPSNDIAGFLDGLKATEEAEITKLLDVRDTFMSEHPDVMQQAEIEFMVQRDEGWPTVEKLPPQVLAILRQAGIGLHGSAAATVFATRWTAAHIESVLLQDASVLAGAPGHIDVIAKVVALRELQKTSGADMREQIFDMELSLPAAFRMMVDINQAHYLLMKIKLALDEDKAQAIARSRETDGPFSDPAELVSRGLLTNAEYGARRTLMVAH